MNLQELATRIIDTLDEAGLMSSYYETAEAKEVVVAMLSGTRKRSKARKDLPDRAPDFVYWIDHGKDGTTHVNCLPAQMATVPDWVAVAEFALHHGSSALSQGEDIHYVVALKGIVEGALDYARAEGVDLKGG